MRLPLVFLLFLFLSAPAMAQNFGNIKPDSVLGNMDPAASKPAAPVARSDFLSNMATHHGDVGAPNTLFTNNGANINRLSDRLFIGAEAIKNSSDNPRTVSTWFSAQPHLSYVDTFSTLLATSPTGTLAASFGSRSSDCHIPECSVVTLRGAPKSSTGTGAAIGMSTYAINDDTVGTYPQVWAAYIEARRLNGVSGETHGFELDIVNFGSTVDIDPYWQSAASGMVAGKTIGMAVNSGGGNTSNPTSVALQFATNSSVFRKGVLFSDASIQGGAFAAGLAVAVESPINYTWRWLDNTGAAKSYLWGEADGLHARGLKFTVESSGSAVLAGNLGISVYPASGTTSWAITTQFSGLEEVDFWNTDIGATVQSFQWLQKTGASTANSLMTLNAAGGLTVKGTMTALALPTSPPGTPSAYVCVDNGGAFYKKSSCP